jgi:hypothetical protein
LGSPQSVIRTTLGFTSRSKSWEASRITSVCEPAVVFLTKIRLLTSAATNAPTLRGSATAEFIWENPSLLSGGEHAIFPAVLRLTKQEQLVLCVVLSLLLVGWAVKAWRTAHPPNRPNELMNLK